MANRKKDRPRTKKDRYQISLSELGWVGLAWSGNATTRQRGIEGPRWSSEGGRGVAAVGGRGATRRKIDFIIDKGVTDRESNTRCIVGEITATYFVVVETREGEGEEGEEGEGEEEEEIGIERYREQSEAYKGRKRSKAAVCKWQSG